MAEKKYKIVDVTALSENDINKMFIKMSEFYTNVHYPRFIADLEEKNGVLLIYNDAGEMSGFSTYKEINAKFEGTTVRSIFSGDTVVDRSSAMSADLFHCFGELLNQTLAKGTSPVYWFLLSKGVRTYLMLPLFFKSYYPGIENKTDEFQIRLLNYLAKKQYPERYDEKQGIIVNTAKDYLLKPEYAEISPEELESPRVKYFVEKNPGYINGDELACIARVDTDNYTRAGKKVTGTK